MGQELLHFGLHFLQITWPFLQHGTGGFLGMLRYYLLLFGFESMELYLGRGLFLNLFFILFSSCRLFSWADSCTKSWSIHIPFSEVSSAFLLASSFLFLASSSFFFCFWLLGLFCPLLLLPFLRCRFVFFSFSRFSCIS